MMKEKILIGAMFLGAIIIPFHVPIVKSFGGVGHEYSDGSRSGTLHKLSKKGLFWKTWEGELSLGLVTKGAEGQLVNEIFHFSVSSDSIAKELEKVAQSGDRVTLEYKQYLYRGYKHGGKSYDIVGFKVQKEEEK